MRAGVLAVGIGPTTAARTQSTSRADLAPAEPPGLVPLEERLDLADEPLEGLPIERSQLLDGERPEAQGPERGEPLRDALDGARPERRVRRRWGPCVLATRWASRTAWASSCRSRMMILQL